MKEELLALLEDVRPDVDFEKEKLLIDGGILDSFDIITIVQEMNEAFDIDIDVEMLEPYNFNTIEGDNAVEKLRGMWMVEMAELLSVKKAKEVEAVKSFVTSTVDVIRPKYARETEQRPRVCVFAGTTNDMDFLSDPTGNRRFLPIHCNAEERQELLFDDDSQEFFDQCWAEVYHKWKEGARSLVLPDNLAKLADDMRDSHTEDDPRVGIIQNYLDAKVQRVGDLEGVDARVCVTELLKDALDISDYRNPPRRLVNEVHAIMRNSVPGWLPYKSATGKAKTGYGVQKCYVPDVDDSRIAEVRLRNR